MDKKKIEKPDSPEYIYHKPKSKLTGKSYTVNLPRIIQIPVMDNKEEGLMG